jgi:hypothetical protein
MNEAEIVAMGPESPSWDPHGAQKDNAWKALAEIAGEAFKKAPKKGKRVKIVGGRKHKGKEGVVFWHGRDPFEGRRYGSEMQQVLSNAIGMFGFRSGIQTDDGEKFFVPSEYCEVI